MNIVIFSNHFSPDVGGIETYAYNLAKKLSINNNVKILTKRVPGFPEKEIIDRIEILRLFPKNKKKLILYLPFYLMKIIKICKSADILHSMSGGQEVILASLFAKISRKKYTVIAHGFDTLRNRNNPILLALIKYSLKAANLVIFDSERVGNFIQKELRMKLDGKVIYPGVCLNHFYPRDTTLLRKRLKIKKNEKVMLTFSRLVERKNVASIIMVFPGVKKEIKNIKYLIGGGGEGEKQLRKLAKKISSDIIFVPELSVSSPVRLPEYYSLADVFVLIPKYVSKSGSIEGFGLVYIEAQACGTPVIGSNSGGVPEAIGNGGLVVEPEDGEGLKKALIAILTNKKLSKKLSKSSLKRSKKFSWNNVAKEYLNTFEKLLNLDGVIK